MTRPPNATILHPLAIARFTHPAFHSLVYSYRPCPLRGYCPPSYPPMCLSPFSFSLSIVSCGARSLNVAAALSNSRCNIQRLLAVVCGGRSGHRHQKKSPTWPEPPTVKLAPLSINRCASGFALSLSLSLFSSSLCFLLAIFYLSFTSRFSPSSPLYFYYFFLSILCSLPRSYIGHRSVDAIFE